MDIKKSIISFYRPFYLYLWKLSRKHTLEKDQSSLTGIFICVNCFMETNLGMLALGIWVCGFAIMFLARML